MLVRRLAGTRKSASTALDTDFRDGILVLIREHPLLDGIDADHIGQFVDLYCTIMGSELSLHQHHCVPPDVVPIDDIHLATAWTYTLMSRPCLDLPPHAKKIACRFLAKARIVEHTLSTHSGDLFDVRDRLVQEFHALNMSEADLADQINVEVVVEAARLAAEGVLTDDVLMRARGFCEDLLLTGC